jgi:hypothetical protein
VEKLDAKEVEERARLELILSTTDDYVAWTETACKLDHLDGTSAFLPSSPCGRQGFVEEDG